MWWLVSRVQLARETVVDELSILVTNARRTYLDTLLAFADDTGLASSPAFSARRHLFHRVMLLSKEDGMSSNRVAIASTVLLAALAGGGWTAVKAFPLTDTGSQRQQQTPPRDPLSPEMHHQIALGYFEKVYPTSTLSPAGQLAALDKGIGAEDRALAMDPDYMPALTYKNILLRLKANLIQDAGERARLLKEADELRQKAMALRPKPPMPPPPPLGPGNAGFAAEVATREAVRVGGNIKAPMKIHDVKPVYPPVAHDARVSGVVIVEALIDQTGSVAEARVLRSIPLLDQAALEAVKKWKFVPTLMNGAPINVVMTVTVNFTLE